MIRRGRTILIYGIDSVAWLCLKVQILKYHITPAFIRLVTCVLCLFRHNSVHVHVLHYMCALSPTLLPSSSSLMWVGKYDRSVQLPPFPLCLGTAYAWMPDDDDDVGRVPTSTGTEHGNCLFLVAPSIDPSMVYRECFFRDRRKRILRIQLGSRHSFLFHMSVEVSRCIVGICVALSTVHDMLGWICVTIMHTVLVDTKWAIKRWVQLSVWQRYAKMWLFYLNCDLINTGIRAAFRGKVPVLSPFPRLFLSLSLLFPYCFQRPFANS